MTGEIIQNLFFLLLLALMGGFAARALKLPLMAGYIFAGCLGSVLLSGSLTGIRAVAEIGLVFLLFSVGLELSLSRISETGSIVIIGAIAQIIFVSMALLILLGILGLPFAEGVILSVSFSLSSTALVVKLLEDRGEIDSIHGRMMIVWLLIQDLAVIPIMALLPTLASKEGSLLFLTLKSFLVAGLTIMFVFFAEPYIRTITNSIGNQRKFT